MIVTKHPFRFLNQKLQAGVSGPTKAILFSYNCAQDNKIKKKSIKVDDTTKRHDWPSMPTFSCESLLKIWLQVIPGEAQEIIDAGINSSFKDVSHD